MEGLNSKHINLMPSFSCEVLNKSSIAYPQSNGHTEVAVKSPKRMIHNNISVDGSLNSDKAARATTEPATS